MWRKKKEKKKTPACGAALCRRRQKGNTMCCCVDAPGGVVGIDLLSLCPIIRPLQILFPLRLSPGRSRRFSRRARRTKTRLKRFEIVRIDTKCSSHILVLVLGYVGISAFFTSTAFLAAWPLILFASH